MKHNCPTFGALALFGNDPRRFMPGLYTQFVRFNGLDKTSEVDDERQFTGCYFEVLPKLEAFLELSIVRKRPVPISVFREDMVLNYPYWALRELVLNAYMHRDMQGNGPIRLYEYDDRIEIMNPGGLYGNARPENFPRVNDYRNPLVAAAFKTMGYVNMFNRGVGEVQKQLKENGNAPAVFNVDNLTAFEAIVYRRSDKKSIKSKVLSCGKGIKSGVTSQEECAKSDSSDNQVNDDVDNEGCNKSGVTSQVGCNKSGVTSQYDIYEKKDGRSCTERNILEFCKRPRSLKEIAQYIGIKAFQRVRSRYIDKLLADGRLVMTVPDKPTSRFQKYVNQISMEFQVDRQMNKKLTDNEA